MTLRKNFITENFTIIAGERKKRKQILSQKNNNSNENKNIKKKFCPFCLKDNKKLKSELVENGDKYEKYGILCAENLYPTLSTNNNYKIYTLENQEKNFNEKSGTYGKSELIIETSKHEELMPSMNINHIKKIIDAYCFRIKELSKIKDINYVLIFKNHGKNSGASQRHEHSQIAATNLIPPKILLKEKLSFDKINNSCKYCKLIEIEKNSKRKIYLDNNVIAFCEFAPKTSYEVKILSLKHKKSLLELNDDEKLSIAKAMKKIILKLKELNVDYNYFIHYGIKNMHLNITFRTRGVMPWGGIELGGIELGSGIYTITTIPEDAAEFYNSYNE